MTVNGVVIKGSRGDYRITDEDGQPLEGVTMAVCYFNLASKRVVADLHAGTSRVATNVPVLAVEYTDVPVAEPRKKGSR